MYTCLPSDVIQGRSDWVVSMIWAVQLAKLLEVSALGQVIAETPSCLILETGLKKKTRVVTCSVPVEPISMSASPPPPTPFLMAASIGPWKTGVEPNAPFQMFVWNSCQDSPLTAIVPSLPMETAGSLSPFGSSNGVLVKLKLPIEVPVLAKAVEKAITSATMMATKTKRCLADGIWSFMVSSSWWLGKC